APLAAPLVARGQVLDEEDGKRVLLAEPRRLPAKLLPRRGPATALGGVGDVDTAPAHGRHVGCQVVALHGDVAEAAAPGEVFGQAGVRASGLHGRPVVALAITQAQELQVVVLVKGNRVVGGPAGVRSAGKDAEADACVGRDALVQVGDADHDVVDTGEHGG